MVKKTILQLFLALLLVSSWVETENIPSLMTSGTISGKIPIFTTLQIELLKSGDAKIAADALNETASALITYLEPDLARETWDCRFVFADILPGGDQELAISLTLAPDRGDLIILQKHNQHYSLLYYLDNLLPLSKLEKLALPNGREILATKEEHRERLGAYSTVHMLKFWVWKDNALAVVWNDNAYWDIN